MLLELLYNAAAPFCCIYNAVAVIMLMQLLDNAADVVIKLKLPSCAVMINLSLCCCYRSDAVASATMLYRSQCYCVYSALVSVILLHL